MPRKAPVTLAPQVPTGLPPVLLPYQQRWIADTSPIKLCEKSRRVGLSWAEAADSALNAAAADGMDTWYVGYNKDMALEFIRDVADWSKHYQLAASEMSEFVFKDEDRDILAFVIRYDSGYRVTALSSRPSNLRGKQGRVVIDEAAFHESLAEILKAAIALLMWGGRVSIISTHNGVDNPFNDLVTETRSGKKPYSLHRITLDDALADGLYQRICLTQSSIWTPQGEEKWRQDLVDFYGDAAEEELSCVPKQSGGAYFTRSLVESRMDSDLPVRTLALPDGFAERPENERVSRVEDWLVSVVGPLIEALPEGLRSAYGFDFGRSGDLSVFAPLVILKNLHRRCPFLLELRNVPFRQQEQILFWVVERLPGFRSGAHDARGNGQYLAEVAMQRFGSTAVEQVMLTQNWYLENMPRYKAAFEDAEITIPKDADVLADHRVFQVIKGIPKIPETGRSKGTDGGQRHGDTAIALALAWYASGQDNWEYEHDSIPRADGDNYGYGYAM